jgi:hypothetical protein
VEKALFSITCTTCRAQLGVRSELAIGAILECPKCGSMVQVLPPEGWEPESQLAPQTAGSETSAVAGPQHAGPQGGSETAAGVGAGLGGPPALGVSPAELAWRKWLLLGAAPAAGLVLVIGVCSIFFWGDGPQGPPRADLRQPADTAPQSQPAPPQTQPDPLPTPFDRRWLPDRTALLFSLRLSKLAAEPSFGQVVVTPSDGHVACPSEWAGGPWRQTLGAVLGTLELEPEAVRRLTWAATDLAAWPAQSVVLIELEPGHDAVLPASAAEAVDLELAGVPWRRLHEGAWKQPFAVIDSRTIVTGSAEILRHLGRRNEVHLQSKAVERLLPFSASDAELSLLMDLAAARRAGWKLPAAVLDVWPSGKQPWRTIWEISEGLACRLQGSDPLRSELVLLCQGETAAEKVEAALDELVPAARNWLATEVEGAAGGLEGGQSPPTRLADYQLLLAEGLAAAKAARWKVVDGMVWVGVDWRRGPSALAAAVIDSRSSILAAWLAAAREVDEANHRWLLAGLGAYRQAEGRFPAAGAAAARLSTEEQLSWIAATLPFYGHEDWHRQLDSGQPWNGPQNRSIAQRSLPEVINPVLGPGLTEAGFPVTHYVGVAGVGPDAGRLKADDPRAGVFGYGRNTRPEDIADGAANTIAVLGVTKNLGAWAAGGAPTVRALTEPPYIDGPDGFGSGQPDGMLAGMADGSVRFLSKNMDPQVLEQLATINGNGHTAAVAPSPKPPRPPLSPVGPAPEAGGPGKTPVEPGAEQPEPLPGPEDGRSAPVEVDLEARLADVLPEIRIRQVPLAEAVDLLAGLSSVPISFDPEAMRELGVTLHDPVTVELSEATVGEVLQKVVSSRGLAAVAEGGQMLLTSPAEHREKLWPRAYTVSDLTGQEPAGHPRSGSVAELAAVVQKLVAPDSWRPNGGRGSIEPDGDALAVVQTSVVHHQVLTFREKLRNARGKPLRSKSSPDQFALESRLDRAQATLSRPVTANFHQPTPLIEVLAYFGKLAEADILVDRLALAAAGLSDRKDASVTVENKPLGEALDELLGPLGLAYRVIDARTLQVTTRKAVDTHLELEFYPVRELLTGATTGPALVEQIKSRLAGSSWSDAGGPGVLYFDQPSGCLIVLQSQPVQGELARLLGELRN